MKKWINEKILNGWMKKMNQWMDEWMKKMNERQKQINEGMDEWTNEQHCPCLPNKIKTLRF